MFPIRAGFSLFIFALLSVNVAFAQSQNAPGSVNLTPSQEFRFISTVKISTFEKELNDWARQGFRFVSLAKAVGVRGLGGLLAREKEGEGSKYEYKALATNKLGAMKKELEAAAAEGFESRGFILQHKAAPFTYPETIVIMERPAGESKRRFDYKFVSTRREKTPQKEIDAAVSEGYFPVDYTFSEEGAVSALFGSGYRYQFAIVLARDADNPSAEMGNREYRFLQTTEVSTMEKEMNQLAKEGFQFQPIFIGLIMIMTRPLKEKTQKYEYKLLVMSPGAMQKKLIEMGVQGYQFVGCQAYKSSLIAVMERGLDVSGRQYEYKFLAATLESTTQKELGEALAGGYKFLEIMALGDRMIVLGRRKEAATETK